MRVVVLPTVLMIQVGTVGYEVDESKQSSQLDMAGRIDDIAVLAEGGRHCSVGGSLRRSRRHGF